MTDVDLTLIKKKNIKRLKDLKKIGEKSRDGKTKFEMKEGK